MTPSQIVSALRSLLAIRQPAFLWGPPGVGKSQVVAQVARQNGLALRDIRAVLLDPVDLRGLPRISADGRSVWCPPAFLPGPADPERGIVFLDELNAAPPLVQAACYQLVLDRAIGEYRLPDGWSIVAAGNREGDRAVAYRMPSALANRMVHLDFTPDLEDWLGWAQGAGIRQEVCAFLRFRPQLLHDFDPARGERAFASPRSWEFVSRILDAAPTRDVEAALLEGAVGAGCAAEFSGFLAVWRDLPTVEEILEAPEGVPVPEEPAALYATCEALSLHADQDTMEALATYAARLPAEFGVLLMRDAVERDAALVESPAFARWAEQNAAVLM
ncbi:ATP-binding protein [Desulfovibrio legallii]|uniref:MoxR family ATPase n=1 Tax=Desulfovibrio legallii TaxID=571438 RepID=A0A6H3FBB3_9BACT|nr:MoxR family ATPase [Desulfovibrio legallii]TBH79881.1 MoxR family ATPase [Desulfovibrio legallii]